MISIILKTIMSFLVIYGFATICKDIFLFFLKDKTGKDSETIIVIKVRNSQDSIESAVRTVIWKCLNLNNGGKIHDILIVDLGSEDDTPIIAKKLSEDYSFVHYTTEDLYNKAKGESNEI